MKKRADGRYQSQMTVGYNENGKPIKKTIYGRTKPELINAMAEARVKLNKGMPVTEKKKKFSEFADFWVKNCKTLIEEQSKQSHITAVNKHLKPYFGNFNMKDIKSYHIDDFIAYKIKEGYTKSEKDAEKKRYAKNTINKMMQTLNSIFKEAVKREYVFSNPIEDIKVPETKKETRQALKKQERELVQNLYAEHRAGIFALALMHTGMRLGEAIALKWSCIDFKNDLIHIEHSSSTFRNQPKEKGTKTLNSERSIPLVEPLKSILKDFNKNSIYVFTSVENKQLTATAFRRMWESYMLFLNNTVNEGKSLKIDIKFTAHQLRHTYATILFEKGISPKTAQMWLGHADIKTTMNIYTHLMEEQSKDEAAKLNFCGMSEVSQNSNKEIAK